MTTCPDCGISLPDSAPDCYHCEYLHQRLRERLMEVDGAASWAVVAGWALTGFEEKRERRWRVG